MLLAVLLTVAALRWWRRVLGGRRQRKGKRDERSAEHLLKRAGYTIIESQPAAKAHVVVDGERRTTTVHADYRVRARDGRELIAEVKGGAQAAPTREATRRQLLEYSLLYADADGLLLVDVRQARVMEIAFDYP